MLDPTLSCCPHSQRKFLLIYKKHESLRLALLAARSVSSENANGATLTAGPPLTTSKKLNELLL